MIVLVNFILRASITFMHFYIDLWKFNQVLCYWKKKYLPKYLIIHTDCLAILIYILQFTLKLNLDIYNPEVNEIEENCK